MGCGWLKVHLFLNLLIKKDQNKSRAPPILYLFCIPASDIIFPAGTQTGRFPSRVIFFPNLVITISRVGFNNLPRHGVYQRVLMGRNMYRSGYFTLLLMNIT